MTTSAPARPRPRNPRGEGARLRTDIVESALALLEETGSPEALSLRAIARRAGVTAPSIYAHFADLDEIVAAVVDQAFRELSTMLEEATADDSDPVACLHAGCHAYLRFAREHPQCYAVLFGRPHPAGAEVSREEFSVGSGGQAFSFLVDGIAACAAAGLSASTDPFTDATLLWSALHGYASLRANSAGFPWPAGETLAESLIDRLARISG